MKYFYEIVCVLFEAGPHCNWREMVSLASRVRQFCGAAAVPPEPGGAVTHQAQRRPNNRSMSDSLSST